MKKVIINGRFLTHRITGVERYAREILMELDKIVEPGQLEMAIPADVLDIPPYKNIVVNRIGKLNNILWEHISFPIYAIIKHAIPLNLCNVAPLIYPGVVCIHDVKIKAMPQFFSKKFLMWYKLIFFNSIKRAKFIITDSGFSKSEILKYYKIDEKKIHVIPLGWQHFEKINYDEKALETYNLKSKEYYFSMCSLEPNKNLNWIAEVAKRNKDELFAVSGSINPKVFSSNLGIEEVENIKFIGYISDEEAKTLMRECKAFLFPTFYEGFGLPPLEAMSVGAKAIISDTPCMREIYGDSVIYINPNNPDINICSLIIDEILDINSTLYKYNWKTSAYKLLDILSII